MSLRRIPGIPGSAVHLFLVVRAATPQLLVLHEDDLLSYPTALHYAVMLWNYLGPTIFRCVALLCVALRGKRESHISWKSWKLIARTISPTPSLFVTQRHPPTPRGTWGNLRETRGVVGKSGVLEHISGNISETRKDRRKGAVTTCVRQTA